MASPTTRDARVRVADGYVKEDRRVRRPQNPFNVITRPFQIQPIMCHPVLPGESLKGLMLQSQVWSDPLATAMKNTGWWCEYNVWYVAHHHLEGFEVGTDGLGRDLVQMFTSAEDISGHRDADGNTWTYCPPNGVDFLKSAMARIVDEYYRDDGEAWNDANKLLDSVPMAQIYGRGRSDAFDKLTNVASYTDRRQKLDADNDGTIYVGDEEMRARMEHAAAYDAGLTDMDYDDWMRAYGGGDRKGWSNPDYVGHHRPEDLAYFREFAYPTNTVEPSTGVPAVAVGWRVARRLNKRAFFPHPGWLIVTNTVRPKVYLENQEGMVAAMMQTRDSWLVPQRHQEWTASHLLVDDLDGPLAATYAADYYLDLRDLLIYGEQFINYTPAGPMFMELPLSTAVRRYAAATEIDELFAAASPANKFRQDGMISLQIVGRQSERTKNLTLGRV